MPRKSPVRTVFISSTYRDLAAHRAAVIKAVEGLDGYHCEVMEHFGARDRASDEFFCQRVAQAVVFVGIIGLL